MTRKASRKKPKKDHTLKDKPAKKAATNKVKAVILFAVALFFFAYMIYSGGNIGSFFALVIGLVSGYSRVADAVVMRIMDGLMAIPAILLAIALMAVTRASIATVILAISVVEIPRIVRLVRSVVLTLREQTYIEAAVIVGTRPLRTLSRHILPNTLAPLIVQTTYICAAAMLIESILSFLGAGTPPEVPSWGNIMAEGRTFFQIAPWLILSPGLLLGLTVLAINLVGDGLRNMLDPRIARRM